MKNLSTLKKHSTQLFSAVCLFVTSASVNAQVSTPQAPPEQLKASLYQLNNDGSTVLADGNLTRYHEVYLDGTSDDFLKITNFGENFGIVREGVKLAIEQRQKISAKDTTYYIMWNMSARNYRLEFTTLNLDHAGLEGELVDSYTGTNTPLALNGITKVDFAIDNNAGSYASGRFKVVFKNPTLTPTTFTGFTATLSGMAALLQWSVDNEYAVENYTIEHSTDNVNYVPIKTVLPSNTGGSRSYTSTDPSIRIGDNFYRIKFTSRLGMTEYSQSEKVVLEAPVKSISIYPNPVVNKIMNVAFPSGIAGKYQMVIYASNGTAQPLPSVMIAGGQTVIPVYLPKTLATGVYRVRIIGPDNSITIKTINVL